MTIPETQWVLAGQRAAEERQLRRRALFVGLAVIAMPVAQILISLLLGGPLVQAEANMARSVADRLAYYGLYIGFYCLMLLAPTGLMAVIFRRPPTLQTGERPPLAFWQAAGLMAFGMAFCVLANFITNYWISLLYMLGVEPMAVPTNTDGGWLPLVLNLITYAVLPGLVEELVYRGWILGALQPFGERRALMLSALIFGLVHGNFTQVPFAFMLGLLFGYLYLRTGRLWPGILLHMLNNAMSVVLEYAMNNLGLTENGYALLQMGLFVALLVLGTVAGLLLHRRGADRTLTAPLLNRRSVVASGRRGALMWGNPAVIVGIVLLAFITVAQEVLL